MAQQQQQQEQSLPRVVTLSEIEEVVSSDGFASRLVDAILDDRPIDIYNHGDMYRDFTYVDDLVRAIRLLIAYKSCKILARSGPIVLAISA